MTEHATTFNEKLSRVRDSRVTRGLGLGVATLAGALALPAAWDTDLATGDYLTTSVRTSLAPSTIEYQTSAGPGTLQFDIPAPGLKVYPYANADAPNKLVQNGGVSIENFIPTRDQQLEFGREFGGKVVLGGLIGAALYERTLNRQSSRRKSLGRSAAASLVCAGVLAGSAWASYSDVDTIDFTLPPAVDALGITEVGSVFNEMQSGGRSFSTLVANIIALSDIEVKESEQDPTRNTRFLLVSDLHGDNPFDVLGDYIQQNDIDAVIDTGDIINFGRLDELTFTGLLDSIDALDVPYIFVKGNHDANSVEYSSVLDAMSKLDNVYIVETNNGEFNEITINGIKIAGFNDPGYFGDDGGRRPAGHENSLRRYLDSVAANYEPDIFVTHEPWMVEQIPAKLTINGHMHAPGLDGRHIQTGTTTASGLLKNYATLEDTDVAISSFGVLRFDGNCQPVSLLNGDIQGKITLYESGDPATFTNHSLRDFRDEEPSDRTCGPIDGETTVAVQQLTKPQPVGGLQP